jgi:hypothetical protein
MTKQSESARRLARAVNPHVGLLEGLRKWNLMACALREAQASAVVTSMTIWTAFYRSAYGSSYPMNTYVKRQHDPRKLHVSIAKLLAAERAKAP